MKKVLTVLIALFMIFTIFPLNTSARIQFDVVNKVENEKSDEMNVVQITDNNGIILSDDSYIVDFSVLEGTNFEGDTVIVRDDGVYVNHVRSNEGIKILIGEDVIGWLIDGIVMYVTGYSGEKIAEKTIATIVSFVASRPEIVIIAILLFTLTGDTIQAYETADGNECVINPSGHGYVCKYSL